MWFKHELRLSRVSWFERSLEVSEVVQVCLKQLAIVRASDNSSVTVKLLVE